MEIDEILPRIKPRNKKVSDKYSANLYKYLSNKDNRHKYIVLRHKPTGDLYLVDTWWTDKALDNWTVVTGAKIWMILCGRKTGSSDEFSAIFMGVLKSDCEDITKTFWPDYIQHGRCVFNPTHDGWLMNDESRFTRFGNNCRCNWCGKWFRKKIKKIVKIERREVWEVVGNGK